MENVIVYELSALGFGPDLEQQLQSHECVELLARVAAEHRGSYEILSQAGVGHAQLAGRLRLEAADFGLPGVGDWVVLKNKPVTNCTTIIERVLIRRTLFTRGAAGREGRAQVIAANVDQVFAVCGLDTDFSIHRIERYLARIWASGAQPNVILNKADLCRDATTRVLEIERRVIGVPIYVTSALQSEGIDAVRECIHPGMTVAFVGSSGAGKSTLVNALLGEERMPTGAVRAGDGRGCHVTTHRQLLVLPGGGLLLDTPGMRELQLVDEDGLDAVFGDIAEFASDCRYRDCRHHTEPGCAVKKAVESGDLTSERLEHFTKLEREAQAYERRHDEKLRRQSERKWGQLHDEAARLRHWKGGKQ